jgi:sulfide dehydrogenase cytochrome subunit
MRSEEPFLIHAGNWSLVRKRLIAESLKGWVRFAVLLGWVVVLQYPPGCLADTGAEQRPTSTETAALSIQGCFPCHGSQGQSGSPAIPSLAGLPRDYLLNVMRAFRHGGRFATVMGRLARAFDDDDLIAMADYFSRQRFETHKQSTDWRLVDRGRWLHRRYCRDCHGDPDKQAKAGVPQLHGRWMDYLRWTLWDYLVGINQGDEEMGKQLSQLMRSQGLEGIEALLHYYGKGKP